MVFRKNGINFKCEREISSVRVWMLEFGKKAVNLWVIGCNNSETVKFYGCCNEFPSNVYGTQIWIHCVFEVVQFGWFGFHYSYMLFPVRIRRFSHIFSNTRVVASSLTDCIYQQIFIRVSVIKTYLVRNVFEYGVSKLHRYIYYARMLAAISNSFTKCIRRTRLTFHLNCWMGKSSQ